MSWELRLFTIPGQVAEVDLTAAQFHAVVFGTDQGEVNLAGAGDRLVGVLQNKPDVGEAAEVMVKGVTKAVAGAAVAIHAALEIDANGRFITLAAGVFAGWALEVAAADGDRITVLLP